MELEPIEFITIIGLIFVLSLIFTLLSYKKIEYFMLWLIIFTTFFIFAGLLEVWILVLLIFISVSTIVLALYKNKRSV